MPTVTTSITAARFAQGLAYKDFVGQALVNRDKFEQYYASAPLSDHDLAFFRKAAAAPNGVANILAIGEAWCGDVYRELPTVARIAEATGMNLRVFIRDQNPDVMDEFLSNDGKARAIPVFVFYSADMRYITRFTERPASAQAEIDAILDELRARFNLPKDATFTNLPDAGRQEIIARIVPRFPDWRKDSVKEMRQLLATALNLPND